MDIETETLIQEMHLHLKRRKKNTKLNARSHWFNSKFGQNHVRIRTKQLNLGNYSPESNHGQLFRPSLGSSAWYNLCILLMISYWLAFYFSDIIVVCTVSICTWTKLPRRIQRTPLMVSPTVTRLTHVGLSWLCACVNGFFFLFASSFFLFASSFFYSRILFSTCEFFSFYSHVLFYNSQVLLSAREFLFLLVSFFYLFTSFFFLLASSFFPLAIDSGLIGISTTCVSRKMAANYRTV